MASRSLIVRYLNHLSNNNKQCKNFSILSALCNNNAKDTNSLLKDEECTTTVKESTVPKEIYKKERESQGYITVVGEVNIVALASGVLTKYKQVRNVLISQPSKNAMQSGTYNLNHWRVSFDTRERWENPLMGWCASGDPYQALIIKFSTKEAAIQHCINMGWNYMVQKPNKIDPKPRSYAENFSWNKRTRVSTK
uniref:NADH dehydrogenase [ubiquinone] iron-sulfur protein 4, mitochondrial n=1 Tax=Ceratosolen solmsi TaxID=142686 RepID=A0A0A1CPY7_9HYME|nr:mitochondrial NADH dehydrogenase (ubiquinone) Fe-S protein 4 [Ceratosolen solmsi]